MRIKHTLLICCAVIIGLTALVGADVVPSIRASTMRLIEQSATSVPTPPSGSQRVFLDSADHAMKRKDSTNTVTAIEGGGGGGSTGNYSFSSNAVDLSGAAEMSIAPTTATGVTIGQRLKAPEVVTTSSAPTLAGGASAYFGTLASITVTGTNQAGIAAFTTGTLSGAPGNDEVLKLTFSGSFTAPTGCVVDWFNAGDANDAATQNWAAAMHNFANDVYIWGVCTTTTCSMYMNIPTSGSFASSTAYKVGYRVDCF